MLVACMLGAGFAALSNALALVARQGETLIGAMTFVLLPLTFLSRAFMQPSLVPGWIADVARLQPRQLGGPGLALRRRAATPTGSSSAPGLRPARGAALFLTVLATRAFRAYQHSI